MTLTAVWLVNDRIYAVADTRISGPGGVLTDHGPKLLPLQLLCSQPGPSGFLQPRFQNTYGFAYAGATLPALSTHAMASVVLTNLSSYEGSLPPEMRQVAYSVAEICFRYMHEIGGASGHNAFFEAIIFGRCLVAGTFKAFHIKPRLIDGAFSVDLSEFDLYAPHSILAIGVNPNLFKDRVNHLREKISHETYRENPQVFEGRLPRRALEEIVREKLDERIGGATQFAWVDQFGFRPLSQGVFVEPTPPSTRNLQLTVLGFDMDGFPNIGPYVFSAQGML